MSISKKNRLKGPFILITISNESKTMAPDETRTSLLVMVMHSFVFSFGLPKTYSLQKSYSCSSALALILDFAIYSSIHFSLPTPEDNQCTRISDKVKKSKFQYPNWSNQVSQCWNRWQSHSIRSRLIKDDGTQIRKTKKVNFHTKDNKFFLFPFFFPLVKEGKWYKS